VLEEGVKERAREAGAALVGIASRGRLEGHACADPSYCLPSARSVISFAVPLDRRVVRDYLAKRDLSARREMAVLEYETYCRLEEIGEAVKEWLEGKGYRAANCERNLDYRNHERGEERWQGARMIAELAQTDPGHPLMQALRSGEVEIYNPDYTPTFSLRYAAVAAGLGRLGWSGNLLTKEYGALVYLGSVVTEAELRSDPQLEENPCSGCRRCASVCPSGFLAVKEAKSVRIGEAEDQVCRHGTLSRCVLCCGGFWRGAREKWSTWSPWRLEIPRTDEEADALIRRTVVEHLLAGGRKTENLLRFVKGIMLGMRKEVMSPDDFGPTCSFCQLVCWGSEEERRENVRLLFSSGVVEEENGELVLRKPVEAK
jgi:epoxyqueuosine reductase